MRKYFDTKDLNTIKNGSIRLSSLSYFRDSEHSNRNDRFEGKWGVGLAAHQEDIFIPREETKYFEFGKCLPDDVILTKNAFLHSRFVNVVDSNKTLILCLSLNDLIDNYGDSFYTITHIDSYISAIEKELKKQISITHTEKDKIFYWGNPNKSMASKTEWEQWVSIIKYINKPFEKIPHFLSVFWKALFYKDDLEFRIVFHCRETVPKTIDLIFSEWQEYVTFDE